MIVVVDTNTFISALLSPAGASRAILRACLEGRLQPLMGAALFAEYESLLGREHLFVSCRLDARQRDTLFNAFLSINNDFMRRHYANTNGNVIFVDGHGESRRTITSEMFVYPGGAPH